MPFNVTRPVPDGWPQRVWFRSRLPCSVPFRNKLSHALSKLRGGQFPHFFEHPFVVVTLENAKQEVPRALRRRKHGVNILDGSLVRRKLRVVTHRFQFKTR